jgi:hypothetical protein
MWPQATAAEEAVLRVESRPGVSEAMVLTPRRMANELVAGQGGAKNVVIVFNGGSGQIWVGKKADGPDAAGNDTEIAAARVRITSTAARPR